MKMVIIVYNEAIDMEVMEVLARNGLKNYTKIMGVFGSGTSSGTHLGNDVWPGKNNLLYIACEDNSARQLLNDIREAKKKLGSEGIKAFSWFLETLT